MAVEMAKLSLWLITLAKDRPFSFVDHALRTGDSLLGLTNLRQLRVAHLDPAWYRQASLDLGFGEIEAAVDRALTLRRDLEAFVVRDIPDADRKAKLLAEADAALDDARLLGDLVVGAALAQLDDADPLAATQVARWARTMVDHTAPEFDRMASRRRLRDLADGWLLERRRAVGEVPQVVWGDRDPFHWSLEFPEAWGRDGFDTIVGNPPVQGGQKITGALGGQYRDYLVTWLANGVRGSADLVAYFYLRAASLLRPSGGFGLIATNTVAQGDTREVRPQRVKKGNTGWWLFERARPALYRAIAPLDRCVVVARVSKTVQPMLLPTGCVFNEKVVVLAYDDVGHFGLFSSGFHHTWAVSHSSTLRTDTQYTPTDCFETFAQPGLTEAVGILGWELNAHRSALMLDREEGLTKTYNRVHDRDEHADDIVRLRQLHVELDCAVRDAYGWSDLDLGHDFHETKFGTRFTFAPVPRLEMLDRLLELNHQRYAVEVQQGLHGKPNGKKRNAAPAGSLTFDGV